MNYCISPIQKVSPLLQTAGLDWEQKEHSTSFHCFPLSSQSGLLVCWPTTESRADHHLFQWNIYSHRLCVYNCGFYYTVNVFKPSEEQALREPFNARCKYGPNGIFPAQTNMKEIFFIGRYLTNDVLIGQISCAGIIQVPFPAAARRDDDD